MLEFSRRLRRIGTLSSSQDSEFHWVSGSPYLGFTAGASFPCSSSPCLPSTDYVDLDNCIVRFCQQEGSNASKPSKTLQIEALGGKHLLSVTVTSSPPSLATDTHFPRPTPSTPTTPTPKARLFLPGAWSNGNQPTSI